MLCDHWADITQNSGHIPEWLSINTVILFFNQNVYQSDFCLAEPLIKDPPDKGQITGYQSRQALVSRM